MSSPTPPTQPVPPVQPAPSPRGVQPAWAAVRPTNTKAILAVSLLSIPPAALVFAILARQEIRRTGEGGWGMATWGMGIAIAVLASYALFFVVYAVLIALAVAGTFAGLDGYGSLAP